MLARPLPGSRAVPVSTFAFLFSQLLAYHRDRCSSVADLETRLEAAGYHVGIRFLELYSLKDMPGKRHTSVVDTLRFVHSTVWPQLFGKPADALERQTEAANSCAYSSLLLLLLHQRVCVFLWGSR